MFKEMIVKVLYSNLIWILCTYAFTHDIHKKMTISELKRIFHVDDHKLVPSYEIVKIHHVQKRYISQGSTKNKFNDVIKPKFFNAPKWNKTIVNIQNQQPIDLHFQAFGSKMNLTLIPNDSLFHNKKNGPRIFTVESNGNKTDDLEYKEVIEDNEEHVGNLYHDYKNQAALLVRQNDTNKRLVVEGSVGNQFVIKPIPVHLIPENSDDEMYLEHDYDDDSQVSIDTGLPIKRIKRSVKSFNHIIYKRNMITNSSNFDYEFLNENNIKTRIKRSTIRRKRTAPYTIYPEILVIVDYDGYRLHGGDNIEIKRYFISFWNGVDLRYKLLKSPKIRISIAGIIISRGRDATPYLENNKVGRDAIDSAAALKDMGEYLFRERKIPAYDIAVAITKYDMCRRRKGGRCTKGTAGFAYVGGACVVNKRLKKVNSVAIIEDTGGFSGIIVAAHEVGHLLGAVHDGSPPPSYLGGPGAENCRWTEGFIMSDLRHTEKGFQWSSCSVESFHHFLNGDTATCLYNTPHEENSLPRVLPGKLLSLDAQCFKDRGTKACFKDERVCSQLFCFDSTSGYCIAYRPAAEGSPCGDGQYCSNGKCITENENIIPDYSHNRPSYVRYNPNTRY